MGLWIKVLMYLILKITLMLGLRVWITRTVRKMDNKGLYIPKMSK